MSMEDSPTQNIDENQLFKEDETDRSTADAVSLFNASLTAALERQKTEILSEFQKIFTRKQSSKCGHFRECSVQWTTINSSVPAGCFRI